MKDFGYDVSNYRQVDPLFGTIEDFDAIVRRAHALGKFVNGIRISHSIALTITEWIDFYSDDIFTFFLFATVFN